MKKIVFFSYFISGIPNFSNMGFFRKRSMFRWSIPLVEIYDVHLYMLG